MNPATRTSPIPHRAGRVPGAPLGTPPRGMVPAGPALPVPRNGSAPAGRPKPVGDGGWALPKPPRDGPPGARPERPAGERPQRRSRRGAAGSGVPRRLTRRLWPKPWARGWWLRRCLALVLLLIATVLALVPATSRSAATVLVLTADHDLRAGPALGPSDLTLTPIDPARVPAGALTDLGAAAGRVLAGPVRRGEILTDARLVGPALPGLPPDAAAVPIRLADLLHPGSRVDVVAAAPDAGEISVVAHDAVVLLVPPPAGDVGPEPNRGRPVVVALPPDRATQVAGFSLQRQLTVTLR